MNLRPEPNPELAGASDEEAVAVVAALEQFIRDTAPAAVRAAADPDVSPWKRAALLEGISRAPDQ